MAATAVGEKETSALVEELRHLMTEKGQGYVPKVNAFLNAYPHLMEVKGCNNPMIIAIRAWDPALVQNCIFHGGNPKALHDCSKNDYKPVNASSIAFQELCNRTNSLKCSDSYEKEYEIYRSILRIFMCGDLPGEKH